MHGFINTLNLNIYAICKKLVIIFLLQPSGIKYLSFYYYLLNNKVHDLTEFFNRLIRYYYDSRQMIFK